MQSFREDFDNRTGEILEYLDLLKFIENSGKEIISSDSSEKRHVITADVRKTLKGTVYILLYNLIESTMREAISFIHDTIYSKKIGFDDLSCSLKKEILKRLKSDFIGIDNVIQKTTNGLNSDISYATFNKRKLFSGNIDKDEIEIKSKIYGFSTSCDYKHTKHGEKLTTVKRHRNDLAHGNVSFSEIGKNTTYTDLETTCLEVIAYLDAITANIESYVKNESYLEPIK
ncbi:MAE_28990/MAE_18760 family HEPN-like nuclease [Yersinia enterocolitica]|uniref:MAE_28990/MAE_18760 family HEPN-like nuclease n=1 Tax=Yersinia TaxID=629 RepID=UPI003AB8D86C